MEQQPGSEALPAEVRVRPHALELLVARLQYRQRTSAHYAMVLLRCPEPDGWLAKRSQVQGMLGLQRRLRRHVSKVSFKESSQGGVLEVCGFNGQRHERQVISSLYQRCYGQLVALSPSDLINARARLLLCGLPILR